MSHPHFEVFLAQAIDEGQDKEAGLGPDELYGLYTSWCLLNKEEPQPPEALWEALKAHRIKPEHNHLGMKGPAAADYIIASAPDLV
ncbi:hypothetical protein ACFVYC_21310 [Pseudarthrobacter sp. NPDC058329]|uniref:hypothetical protein n=1 Tax=Pseudarthrobacter sp. NPDC058329 TaxID=3346448 RepID=UPI0036DDEE6C